MKSKPYLRVIDNSIDTIALQGGLTAHVFYDDWQDDPLTQDDYFASFAINAWHKQCNRQDSDFCHSDKPDFERDIYEPFRDYYDLAFRRYLSVESILDNINIGAIVCYALYWQNTSDRECLSDKQHEALMRAYRKLCKQYFVVPLGLHDHSSLHFYTGISHGWDNSTIGFVAVSRKNVWSDKPYNDEECERLIKEALEAYNAYANGWIMSVCVENENGEVIDTCNGFYDDNAVSAWLDSEYGLLKEAA